MRLRPQARIMSAVRSWFPGNKAGKIEYRLDKNNIVHVPVGKASFTEEALQENFKALMDAIVKAKPSALKGQFLRSTTLTSTMGPGVKVSVAKF